jgi:hypothetical protein
MWPEGLLQCCPKSSRYVAKRAEECQESIIYFFLTYLRVDDADGKSIFLFKEPTTADATLRQHASK